MDRDHRPPHPLARARHILGVSQVEIARLAKVHPATVSAIESGRRPSPDLAARLAAAVGADVETIFPSREQP